MKKMDIIICTILILKVEMELISLSDNLNYNGSSFKIS